MPTRRRARMPKSRVLAVLAAAAFGSGLPLLPRAAADEPRAGTRAIKDLSPDELAATVDTIAAHPLLPAPAKIHALEQLLEARGKTRKPWFFRATNVLGRLYLSVGGRESAIHYLELAVDGLPNDADLLNTLGYLYAEENAQLERAAALIRRALEVVPADTPPPVVGYYRDSLGWALFRQGKLDSALAELETANRLAPATAEIRDHLVEVYDVLGRREDAEAILVEDLVAARGIDPERRSRLRRLYRTTPQGKPIAAEVEVERQVIAHEAAEIAAIEAEGGRVIRLESSDGFPLVASVYPAAKERAPAAVLVPMLSGERTDYRRLAHELVRAGITALCLDLRGHGASVTEELANPGVFQEDLPRHLRDAVLDVEAAIGYLRGAQVTRKGEPLALIGASFGGFLAALAARDEEAVSALVLLSPGAAEPYTKAVGSRRDRPTLLVVAEEDADGRKGADIMLKHLDPSRSRLVVYRDAGYGTEMLERAPDLVPLIARWLGDAFKGARGL